MRRIGTVIVVVLTVLAGIALPAVGLEAAAVDGSAVWGQTETADGAENETAEAAPGTKLAGSVGVQGAELGGELESRSLAHRLNRSTSNDTKAAVIAQQVNQSRDRLAALEAERDRLKEARENGSITAQEYRVRAAQLSARAAALERVTNQTAESASELPNETLERNGVNVTAIRTLRTEASELTGPEVAAIARTIAGPRVGSGFGPNAANESRSGPPGDGPGGADERGRSGDGSGSGDGRSAGGQNERGGEQADDGRDSGSENSTADGAGDGRESSPSGDDGADASSSGGESGSTSQSTEDDAN